MYREVLRQINQKLIKINFRKQIHTLECINTFPVMSVQRNFLIIAEFDPG